jgi:hypothetical protein
VIRKRPGIPMPSGRGAAEDQSVPHDPRAKGLTTVVQPHQVRRIPERLICAAQLILVLRDNDGYTSTATGSLDGSQRRERTVFLLVSCRFRGR